MKFHTLYGGATSSQNATFDHVKEYITEKFRTYKDYDDVVTALRDMKKPDTEAWEPVLSQEYMSVPDAEGKVYDKDGIELSITDQHELKTRNDGKKENFQVAIKEYRKRKRTFEIAYKNAYGRIMGDYVSTQLKSRIKADARFDAVVDDPVQLLTVIRELMFDQGRARYPPLVIIKMVQNFMTIKQHEDENLDRFRERFKSTRDALVSVMGVNWF